MLSTAGHASERPPLSARIDASLAKAARFLLKRQSPDGAWRSSTYGFLKDGPSLTPLVLNTLYFLPQGGESGKKALRQGAGYLIQRVGEDGKLKERGLRYPVLTAGAACRVISLEPQTPETKRAIAAWLDTLRQYRLRKELGWQPSDVEFGGWGFSLEPPQKPAPGTPKPMYCESNMVATIFGILGLRAAKVPADSPEYQEVLTFVRRCQNFAETPDTSDPRYDDGGFFFIPDDALQNKAGVAGKDRFGKTRFHSYGSMTADGLRALLRCGLPPDHPRVVAARKWLEKNFSATTHPGDFPPDREVLRRSNTLYYGWAVAHAFLALNLHTLETPNGKVNWAESLAEAILKQQRPDGSWANRFTASQEDDPLIGTSWAAATLAICRQMLTTP